MSDHSVTFAAAPLTDACDRIYADRDHVCLGISPFNGYYTQDRITELTGWAQETFDSVSFYVPDLSPAHTFRALGYEPNKARQKARKQAKYLLNKIRTGMAAVGMEPDESRILWSGTLETNERYRELSSTVRTAFDIDDEFRETLLDATSWILAGALPPGTTPTREQRVVSAEYLLDEFPLFLDAAGIAGQSSSLFVYHQHVELLQRLFDGELSLRPEKRQGFLVVADAEDLASV